MRLAAYEDAIYHRDADGLTVHRAFPTFMAGLAAEVDHLVVLGRQDPEPGRSHYDVPPEVEFVALPHYGALTDVPRALRALAGSLRRFWSVLGRVDAIWLNGPHPLGLLVAPLARLRRRAVILGVRQNTAEYARMRHPHNRAARAALLALERAWRLYARRMPVVVVGPELATLYARAPRVHELAVSMVAEADIAPAAVAAARDYGAERRILSVGRLEQEKNPLLLADILRVLVDGGGEWRLLVVGEGPMAGELERRLAELGVADRAELLGYVPLDRGLLDLYRSSHVFLHVSWTEGLPQVLLEAFGARLPVAATDVGGVGAVARGASVLVGPGDAEAAAAAVRRLAEEPELRDELIEAGVHTIRARTREAERGRLAAFIHAAANGTG